MKKKLLLILSFAFATQHLFAQGESWNWYFGNNAGVNFSTGSPVAVTNNAFATIEGVATISDNSGNLLFYSDGSNVYNANHVIMPNGTGLLGHPSSTQSAIIAKKPGSSNLYYIFTVDCAENIPVIGTGFCYSVVDMLLDGGLGDIVASEKNILVREKAYEKLTAVLHANNTDFWILINDWVDDAIYSYQLSASGLGTTPVISNVGPIHDHTPLKTLGYIKASMQSDRLALATLEFESFTLLDFDNSTGIASNRIDITGTPATMHRTYGVEFSPNGTKLYGTTIGVPYRIFQFDLSLGNGDTIYKYRTVLDSSNVTLSSCNYYFGAVQLAPDGKIYGVVQCDSSLNVISSPDSLGISCNYISQAVSLNGRLGQLGLPNFVTAYILPNSIDAASISEANDFVIYPTPTSTYLTLSIKNGINKKNTSYLISDVLGNIILKSYFSTGLTRIELNNLSGGIYFLLVNYDGVFVTRKFVIAR